MLSEPILDLISKEGSKDLTLFLNNTAYKLEEAKIPNLAQTLSKSSDSEAVPSTTRSSFDTLDENTKNEFINERFNQTAPTQSAHQTQAQAHKNKELNKQEEMDDIESLFKEVFVNTTTNTCSEKSTDLVNTPDFKIKIKQIIDLVANHVYSNPNLLVQLSEYKEQYILLQHDFDVLSLQKIQIDAVVSKRKAIIFKTICALLVCQFGISYFAIYNVPWLGWDIIEPITYSISQGTFLVLFWFYLRCAKNTFAETFEADGFYNRMKIKLYSKKGFDYPKYLRISNQIQKLKQEISNIEKEISAN